MPVSKTETARTNALLKYADANNALLKKLIKGADDAAELADLRKTADDALAASAAANKLHFDPPVETAPEAKPKSNGKAKEKPEPATA